jgi:hypothetical protein
VFHIVSAEKWQNIFLVIMLISWLVFLFHKSEPWCHQNLRRLITFCRGRTKGIFFRKKYQIRELFQEKWGPPAAEEKNNEIIKTAINFLSDKQKSAYRTAKVILNCNQCHITERWHLFLLCSRNTFLPLCNVANVTHVADITNKGTELRIDVFHLWCYLTHFFIIKPNSCTNFTN